MKAPTTRHRQQPDLSIHLTIGDDSFRFDGAVPLSIVLTVFEAWSLARLGQRGLAEGLNASAAELNAAILKAGK